VEVAADWRKRFATTGRTGDVGAAGERYLAQELRQVSDAARELFTEMAGQPEWKYAREAGLLDPLYGAWLDGELPGLDVPPRYLPGDQDLVDYWRRVARFASKDVPRGELLDEVTDVRGRPWSVSAARLPGDTGPGSRTAVLATGPGGGSYVLAEAVPLEQAHATVHEVLEQGATLVGLAAALAAPAPAPAPAPTA
jgi:hypothetical protein